MTIKMFLMMCLMGPDQKLQCFVHGRVIAFTTEAAIGFLGRFEDRKLVTFES